MGRIVTASLVGALLLGCLAYGSKCPERESITRHVLCYYEGRASLNNVNLCNCTHIIMTNAVRVANNYTLDMVEGTNKDLDLIKDRKHSLTRIFTLDVRRDVDSNLLESETKSQQLLNGIADFLKSTDFNGVELNFPFAVRDAVTKDQIATFVKTLKKSLGNSSHARVKRAGYDVSEDVRDDITTAPYRMSTAKSVRSSDKQTSVKKSPAKRRKSHRAPRYGRRELEEEEEEVAAAAAKEIARTEKRSRRMRKELRERSSDGELSNAAVLVRLPVDPEVIAKKFDLKALSKYADLLVLSTHNITDQSESRLTYHPSRLMGLSDMLNSDSILDFLTGLGATKSKLVLTLPATILKFRLLDPRKTTPRSPRMGDPQVIDQSELCSLFGKGNWTVERDDDLTAPYAFSDKVWLAYEDKISVNIKAKYILLRELAGGAIYPVDADTGRDPCNDTSDSVGFLTNALYGSVASLDRKPRGLVLESLQQDIHDTAYSTVEAGVRLSEYRIVRVVDHSGAVHVIRKNTKTQFECSRQGYFSHPLGCNKFYRCVKFNQYTDDYTVFEYDCPAGLAFDERWEVCVWPGSLPHGAPCTGSSEIAPVPRSHYQCPNHEGYYADPENCRWFFACLDHARDGVTPLTAYEFRCPFGLVFNEQNLACDWPWNVGACGNRGFSGVVLEHHGGSSGSLLTATYASSGGFASASGHYGGYQGGSSSNQFGASGGGHAGSGYIAGHFEDNQDRASFATVPEYEVSGGRILNRGGLVLNQNVNLHGVSDGSGSGAAFGVGHSSGGFGHSQVVSQNLNFHGGAGGAAAFGSHSAGGFGHSQDVNQNINLHTGSAALGGASAFGSHSSGGFGHSQNFNLHGASGASGGAVAFGSHSRGGFGHSQDAHQNVNLHGASAASGSDAAFGGHSSSGFEHAQVVSQNVNLHGGSAALGGASAFGGHSSGGFGHSETGGQVYTATPVVQTIQTATQKSQFAYNPPLSSPRPFSVSIPQVQVNEEDNSAAYVGGSTTPRVETVVLGDKAASGGVTTSHTVFSHDTSGFGQKINTFGGYNAGGRVDIRVSTPSPIQGVHSVSSGYDQASHISASTSGYDHVGIDQSNSLFQASGFGAANVGSYKVSSTTPAPSIAVSQQHGTGVFVAPQAEVHTYQSGTLHKISGGYAGAGGLFDASNATAFVRGPAVQVSTSAPFSGHFDTISGGKSAGNAILLEEHIERVVIPKVVTPTVSYEQPTISVKPAVAFTTPKPAVFASVTPAAVTVQHQNYVGSVQFSSPAPFSLRKEIVQQPVVSTPASATYKAPEYLPPVEQSVRFQPAVQTNIVQSSPAPSVFRRPEYAGRVGGGVTVLKPVAPTTFVSTPAPAVFKAQEYLPPVQSGAAVSAVQQNVNHFVRPTVQTNVVQSAVSPATTNVFKRPEYVAGGVTFESGRIDVKSGVQNVQTYTQGPVVVQQPVVSTPAPAVFKGEEYLPPAQSTVTVSNVQHVRPTAQTKFVRPAVSTPATAIFKRPEFVAVDQGRFDFKPTVQTFSQPSVTVQEVVSTPATIFKRPDYIPFQQERVDFKFGVQRNEQAFAHGPAVQSVVSTPATTVYKQPEYVAVDQRRVDFKSAVQQNVQTYSQGPVVQEVVQPVVSTPAPAVFKAQEYLPPVRSGAAVSSVQQNVNFVRPTVQTNLVQSVVSTPATTVYKRPELVAVDQGRINFKSNVQQNVRTFAQSPVVVQQPAVTTSAPAVFKAAEYLPPAQSGVAITSVQENVAPVRPINVVQPAVSTYHRRPEFVAVNQGRVDGEVTVLKPTVQTKFVQSVVSTPATTVYKQPEYVAVDQGRVDFKSVVQENVQTYSQGPVVQEVVKPVVSTPEPSVYKAPEYLPPLQTGSVASSGQQSYVQDVKFVQSTPAPIRQSYIQQTKIIQPIKQERVNFVPSTTVAPVVYEKEVPASVSFPSVSFRQDILRSRAKPKQLLIQPEVSVGGYQQDVHVSVGRPQAVEYSKPLTTPAPSPAQVFGYQSTPRAYEVTTTARPIVVVQENLPQVVVTQNTLEQSTPKPYVYEEYVAISSPKPEERLQQPIVVTGKPFIRQQPRKQQKTVYFESYERTNPVVTALEKEVVHQEYQVSSESPLTVNHVEETVDYLPPTGEEIENYSNFEFQKIGKGSSGVLVQGTGVYTSGAQAQSYDSGAYKVNSNIEIAPPSEEYLLSVTPQVVSTTTVLPIQTSTAYRARARPVTTTTTTERYADYDTGRDKATIISVGQVNRDEADEENVESLLEKYSGGFGGRDGKFVTKIVRGEERGEFVVGNEQDESTVGYEVSKSRSRSRGRYKSAHRAEEAGGQSEDATVASLDLKNLKLKKDKKTVIVVSQVSDTNPLLIGKLAGQCSCQSNKLQVRKKVRVGGRKTTSSTTYAPTEEVTSENVLDSLAIEAVSPQSSTEGVILIDGSRSAGKPRQRLFTPETGRKRRPSGRSRYDEPSGNDIGQALFTPVPADEIASTADFAGSKVSAGAAFDRYGPGGLRGLDEALQGSVDCERPGLFRHPKYCNKFYACNYDPWKKRYTLHVFNCPIHLSYDSSISACNWPSKGPACSDDHLLI